MGAIEDLYREIHGCKLCGLCKGRRYAVPGEGPAKPQVMFVGEAPGFHEDQQGRPFVGAAGQFLESLLLGISLSRREVYICNVVKCRPPENRDPLPDELVACRPYLERQISLLKPKMIVTLGRYSMELAYKGVSITKVHGMPKKVGEITYLPMFHPAAALHQPKYRSMIEEDFARIPAIIAELTKVEAPPPEAPPEPPQQLSLFG
jgi:uracil-DNA glycosylase